MHVEFIHHATGPERLVTDAEIVFDEADTPLAGMKLVGFCLWRSPEDEVYVTLPSRAFGAGNERKYFEYLRSMEGVPGDVKKVKEWILGEFHARRAA